MKDRARAGGLLVLVAVLLGVALLAVGGAPDEALAQSRERFKWAIVDKLTILEGGATFNSDVTMNDDLSLVGDLSVDDLTVAGYIQADGFYVTNTSGNTLITGTLDLDGAATLNSTLDVDGNISSGTGAITITDNVLIDGAADAIQLQVQGYTTQTSTLQTWEQSDGTDVGTMSNAGALDVVSTVNYGANDLYPVGFATSGQQVKYGTASITGTLAAPHGLTTVTFCVATLGEDPAAGAGDAAHVTVAVAGNVCTLKAWQDDFVTAATETDVAVQWMVVGAP